MAADTVSHQLLNVVAHQKNRYHEQWFGKSSCVLVVEKLITPDGKKAKRVLKNVDPTVRYHITAPAHQAAQTHAELAVEISKCVPYESKIEDLVLHVAQLTGQERYYEEVRGPGQNRRRAVIHDHPFAHGSDVNLVDHYIDRYMEHFKSSLDMVSPLDLAFADIEVDPVEHRGFPDERDAPCPVSLITYLHAPSKKVTQFALRKTVRDNPQIAEFESELPAYQTWLLCEANRTPLARAGMVGEGADWTDIAAALGLDPMTGEETDVATDGWQHARCRAVTVRFYDSEVDLILDFLHLVNELDRPDAICWWNMAFDANTLMNRLRRLGVDPEDAFTPKDFHPWTLADYQYDTFNTEPTERSDTFNVASYTLWVDQMLLYAQLRKQSGKKESYGLDFTLRSEIGESKVEYEGSIRDLSYRDFPAFMLYGLMDVVPMATLEEKTEDIALAYQLSMMTRTRFNKVLKKTICLRNLAAVFYRERGLALSNNRNRNKERTDTAKFQGA
jgi:hypothetical protein